MAAYRSQEMRFLAILFLYIWCSRCFVGIIGPTFTDESTLSAHSSGHSALNLQPIARGRFSIHFTSSEVTGWKQFRFYSGHLSPSVFPVREALPLGATNLPSDSCLTKIPSIPSAGITQ